MDFCYGHSWDIGLSSLLTWAVGSAPSKDTLWTSTNGRFAVPGCPWTADHEAPAVATHVLLALLSTGPVGISDAIGATNATLVRRMIRSDGTLLKPARPVVAVDSTLAANASPPGQVMATHAPSDGDARVHLFLSFMLEAPWPVPASQLYPPIPDSQLPRTFAIRSFDDSGAVSCEHGADAIAGGCVDALVSVHSPHDHLFVAPRSDHSNVTGGTNYRPSLTAAWPVCPTSGWVLLGELDKYVPVSAQRFAKAACTSTGVSAAVCGAAGEKEVVVTALRPSPSGAPAREVVRSNVALPAAGGCVDLTLPSAEPSLAASTAAVDLASSTAGGLPTPLNLFAAAVTGFHDCIQLKNRARRPPNMRNGAASSPSSAPCSGGLCLGMHGGPHEGGPAAYPVGDAATGYTSVHATMTVPEPPARLDGITYYIWTDIFFGDQSQGRMCAGPRDSSLAPP
eukprot:1862287-Prymnesium_polylepis.1